MEPNYVVAPEMDINSAIRNLESGMTGETEGQEMARREIIPDPALLVRFYVGAEKLQSDADGAPVYREKICVLVQVKGDKDSVTQEVTEEHIQRFPNEWNHFKKLSEKPPQIPLMALPKMRPNIMRALEELGIRSVQELNAKDVPGYLNKWKLWARYIVALHEQSDQAKPRLRVA